MSRNLIKMILSINVVVRNKLPTSVGREFTQAVIDFRQFTIEIRLVKTL